MSKVPEITVLFWVVKILTTGTGEAASDYLAKHGIVRAAVIGLTLLAIALAAQLRARRYVPAVYWTAVLAVAVFGTMAADGAHVVLGIPYPITSTLYSLAVAGVFAAWYAVEGTLDIHGIRTRRRELFYWTAVLSTFALGTAVGDLSAFTLGLGFLPSALGYAALIAVPPVARWRFGLHPVVAFWSAYVLTRPLGASLADWIGKPASLSGLGLGDGTVTLVSLGLIALAVAWMTFGDRSTAPSESDEEIVRRSTVV